MADMPAEVSANPPAPRPAAGRGLDMSFLVGFGSLPIVRQIGLMIGLAASVALGVAVVLWSQDEEYRPLTGVVSARQTNEVAEVLSSSGIPHRLDPASGMLLVPAERIHEARMKMAGANVVDGSQMGFELLDQEQGFGVSQFMEVARYRRSLEGELARSIASLNSVHNARVHLAIPKRTAFVRDQRKATASVTLALAPGATLDGDQVQAVMNLVAGAVPELSPEDVAVVDQRGALLSRKDEDPALERTERQLAYIQRLEAKLQEKVANILTTVAGPDRFRAEVNADVDFTTVEETEESYDPEQSVLRSEQNLEESRTGGNLAAGIPGALANQPPGGGVAPETAEQAVGAPGAAARPEQTRIQSTRNFEVDRTISHTRHQAGQVARLTVSVVLDDVRPGGAAADAEGDQPAWSDAELERVSALVKTAVGFREDRGDTVTVMSSPFVLGEVDPVEASPFWMEPWFLELMKQVLGAIIVLLIVIVLLRPLFRNLSDAGESIRNHKNMALQAQAAAAGGGAVAGQLGSDRKLESVRTLVHEQPETVARVVKQWTLGNE
ncbi:MAG: flagellar M-ring protein FliF [Gammaproteobacteria bacterium]|nr:flagellar M-ring protein FliF [Gammaproteobacteria bacterium]|tara:strand:- start:4310 stop:5971 length:1662 start_codon:yes stop_codon:yes gene_type:complete